MGSQVTDGFGDPKEPSKKTRSNPFVFRRVTLGDTLGGHLQPTNVGISFATLWLEDVGYLVVFPLQTDGV